MTLKKSIAFLRKPTGISGFEASLAISLHNKSLQLNLLDLDVLEWAFVEARLDTLGREVSKAFPQFSISMFTLHLAAGPKQAS